MDKDLQTQFALLRDFSESLHLKAKDILPQMEKALNGESELPQGCDDNETLAAFQLRQIEEKLGEVISAFVYIEKALTPQTAKRHIFIHTCASANRLHGTVSFWWDRPPSDEDKTEVLALGRLFGSDS